MPGASPLCSSKGVWDVLFAPHARCGEAGWRRRRMSRAQLRQSRGIDPWERPDLHPPGAVLGLAEKIFIFFPPTTSSLLAGAVLISRLELFAGTSPIQVPEMWSRMMLSRCIYPPCCWARSEARARKRLGFGLAPVLGHQPIWSNSKEW